MNAISIQKKPKRFTTAEAMLVFLDEIEKNTVKSAEAVKALLTMPETLVKAIERQTERLLPQPYPVQQPLDFSPVVNATLSVANQVVISGNKSSTVLVQKIESLLESNRAIIAQLEILNRPKKWKFNIDRNYKTNLIQGVTAEVLE